MPAEPAEQFARRYRRRPLAEIGPGDRVGLGRALVERLLPHRDPFLFVDRITGFDAANRTVEGLRRIDPADPVFAGHFPHDPVYPGVLLLEMMGQLGLCWFGLRHERGELIVDSGCARRIRAVKIHHAVFVAPVRPGDELRILSRVLEYDEFTGLCAGQVLRGDEVCCVGVMEVYLVEP